MKKISKILVAIAASLVLLFTPVMLVGCNSEQNLTNKELNDLVATTAAQFFTHHTTDSEYFQDIVYQWKQNTVDIIDKAVSYKENASDDHLVEFNKQFKTIIKTNYKLTISKPEKDLFMCQYTISTDKTEYGFDTNSDQTLKSTTDVQASVEVYRFIFNVNGSTNFAMVREYSLRENDSEMSTEKTYTILTQESWNEQINNALMAANTAVKNGFPLISNNTLIYGIGSFSAIKNDNKTHISQSVEDMTYINSETFKVFRYSTKSDAYIDLDQIEKIENYVFAKKQEGTYQSHESTVTFNYTNAVEFDSNNDVSSHIVDSSLVDKFNSSIQKLETLNDMELF